MSRAGLLRVEANGPSRRTSREDRRLAVMVRESSRARAHVLTAARAILEDLLADDEHVSRKRVDSADAGAGPRGSGSSPVQVHDDERTRPAGRAEPPDRALRGRGAQPALGRRHDRAAQSARAAASSSPPSSTCTRGSSSAGRSAPSTTGTSSFAALEMALRRRCPEAGLLHHSDQGSPYASEDYQNVLGAHGITCSMSRRGNCYDNAAAGELVLDAEGRARRALRELRRSQGAALRLHRGLLQPAAPALGSGLRQPSRVRKDRSGSVGSVEKLSTRSDQAHPLAPRRSLSPAPRRRLLSHPYERRELPPQSTQSSREVHIPIGVPLRTGHLYER